jgi:hypothetical protein
MYEMVETLTNIWEMRNAHTILVKKHKRKRPHRLNLGKHGRVILKKGLTEIRCEGGKGAKLI